MGTSNTREFILESASRLFATAGYSAVSMRDVASESGVTPANLYHYFKDKEDLVRESLAFVFTDKTNPIEEIMKSPGDPAKRMERFLLWFSWLLMEDVIFSKLLFRELLDGDGSRLKYLAENVFQSPFSILVQLIDDYFETSDPVFVAVSIVGALLGHCQLSGMVSYLKEGKPERISPEAITRQIMMELQFKVRATNKSVGRSENA
ncbi:TetR/AcrR family transcriptional regulator [Paucidesulfovibrio longus]|uniref:TetR/AcrR family transcriptional regulator n=1 Tax=Paucidesulfovibrio longus TaxID=889 RepID=UPI0003B52909|nr:TetR/AcrR family transcriptional regulator [Paucidesulfovibrio longus]